VDGSDIGRVVIALLFQEAQVLFGFFEINLYGPAQRIEFKNFGRR
jgi:hypothetical protein